VGSRVDFGASGEGAGREGLLMDPLLLNTFHDPSAKSAHHACTGQTSLSEVRCSAWVLRRVGVLLFVELHEPVKNLCGNGLCFWSYCALKRFADFV